MPKKNSLSRSGTASLASSSMATGSQGLSGRRQSMHVKIEGSLQLPPAPRKSAQELQLELVDHRVSERNDLQRQEKQKLRATMVKTAVREGREQEISLSEDDSDGSDDVPISSSEEEDEDDVQLFGATNRPRRLALPTRLTKVVEELLENVDMNGIQGGLGCYGRPAFGFGFLLGPCLFPSRFAG